jgi:hypothetical protein
MPLAFAWLWFGGGLLGLIYLIALITAGVMTLRGGHIIMFVLGFFLPILWIFGAVMSPVSRY